MAYSSIQLKNRKREVLSNFKGVDAASPVYAVDKARATAMRNFIAENGSNHKRPGWRQIARFKDSNDNDQAINGYFKFTINKQEYHIVYAGTTFYIYDNSTNNFVNIQERMDMSIDNAFDTTRLVDRPIQMFVYGERAYFIGCGDFLVFDNSKGTPELRRLYNDEIAYIPRTTTNISPNENEVNADNQPILYGERKTDRDVNALSKWRYNELIGSEQATETTLRTYTLDTDNVDLGSITVELDDYDADTGKINHHTLKQGDATADWIVNEAVIQDRRPVVGDDLAGKTLQFDTDINSLGTLRWYGLLLSTENTKLYLQEETSNWDKVFLNLQIKKGETVTTKTIGYAYRSSWLARYTMVWYDEAKNGIGVDAHNKNVVTFADTNGLKMLGIHADGLSGLAFELIEFGGTKWGYVDYYSGQIAFKKPVHTIQGESNIRVKFAKTDEKSAENILRCRFGTYFGTNGNANTLFLSGNEDVPNMDFWSETENFNYFPSGNCCAVGTPNTAIKGYMRLGDDSLAILKAESRYEPTLYVRTGVAPSVDENNVIKTGYYYTRGKFITEGAVSDSSCCMLAGDPIFLSKQGVFGIVMTDNVAVEERVARERSRFINPLLAKHKNLSKAVAIVYDNRYYLAIDGNVYVADARYTHTAKGDMPDTFNYEWWVWDNCPVRDWYEIEGELCFGTDDGRICLFDKEFTDRKYESLGAPTVDIENNYLYYDTTCGTTLADGDLCYVKGNLYRLLNISSNNNEITFDESMLGLIHAGMVVYADNVGTSGLELDTKYIINNIDAAELCLTLSKEDGTEVKINGGGFRLLCPIDGEIMRACFVLGDDGEMHLQVRNKDTNELYQLAIYDGNALSATLYKYYCDNVVAEWYSPVLDMGTNDFIKQLQKLTIATEQITNGRITFGWETKSASTLVDMDAKGLDVFDFSNLNFAKFAFDTGFSSSYSRDVKADFNFILFRFISDNDCDCSVYSFTITYKINRQNKGVF